MKTHTIRDLVGDCWPAAMLARVTDLESAGWRVTSCDNFGGEATVYLAKRGSHRGQTVYCEVIVDTDGCAYVR